MRLRLPFPITPKAWVRRRRAKETDLGRTYGWFIEKNGEKIGELEYLRWDSLGQFWHEYSVSWKSKESEVYERETDAWIKDHLSLRNRHYQDVVVSVFLTSTLRVGVIAVKSAWVPEEKL